MINVLVVDVGGTHVKLFASEGARNARFDSSPELTPEQLIAEVRRLTHDWTYEVVSVGFPGAVDEQGVRAEPGNLGSGWVRFDFERAFGRPVRIVNDAVLHALGGYQGGRMLFLGLGTGLASALVSERVIVPMELGCLPDGEEETLADVIGGKGLERLGRERWQARVRTTACSLKDAFTADYVVLGGGNARHVDPLPADTRRGGNEDAFTGGVRLWEQTIEPHDQPAPRTWRVVR